VIFFGTPAPSCNPICASATSELLGPVMRSVLVFPVRCYN
jgi:hypothetical protein